MFTSIGKNTITTTTAAFDCQSKPNHITRIGARPTIGSAATKLPIGSKPALQEGRAVDRDRRQEGRPRSRSGSPAARPSGRSARSRPTASAIDRNLRRNRLGAGRITGATLKPAHQPLPQDQHRHAEDQRHQQPPARVRDQRAARQRRRSAPRPPARPPWQSTSTLMPAPPSAPARKPLDQAHRHDQQPRQDRRRKQRRPHDQRLAELRPDQHPRAQPLDGPGRQFAHDGPDQTTPQSPPSARRRNTASRPAAAASGTSAPRSRHRSSAGPAASDPALRSPFTMLTSTGKNDRYAAMIAFGTSRPVEPQLARHHDDHRRQRHDGNGLADDRPGHHAHVHHPEPDDGHRQQRRRTMIPSPKPIIVPLKVTKPW